MSEVVWETLQYFQKFAKPAYVLDFQCYMGQSAFQTSSENSFPSPRRFSVSLSLFFFLNSVTFLHSSWLVEIPGLGLWSPLCHDGYLTEPWHCSYSKFLTYPFYGWRIAFSTGTGSQSELFFIPPLFLPTNFGTRSNQICVFSCLTKANILIYFQIGLWMCHR